VSSKKIQSYSPLLSASLLISATSLASRLLGLLRDRLLAGNFGAGDTLDIYYTSFRIPDLIFNLLILGALHSAFIPVFKDFITKNQHHKAWQVANRLLNVILLAMIILAVLTFVFARPLTNFIAPGFDPEKLAATANLTRIMLLSPIFFSLSAISGGILNSFKKFLSYSFAPIMYNLGIIFGILVLVPRYGINGLAYGVVLGAALNFVVQIPELLQTGFRYQLQLNFADRDLHRIFALMIPTTLSLSITQINLTVENMIGSTLTSGSIAIFNLANNLQSLPLGIFAIAICVAVFPNLVELISAKKYQDFAHQFNKSASQILYVIIPATIFLYIFRAQIVRLLLGTGAFGWQDTTLTLTALGFFALSLPFQSLNHLFARGFYASQNTIKPLIASSISMIANIILSLTLTRFMGVAGLALSFTLSSMLNFIILNIQFYKHIPSFHYTAIPTISKIFIFSVTAGLTSYFALHFFEKLFNNTTFIGLFWQTATSSIIGMSVYFVLSYIFQLSELNSLLKILKIKRSDSSH